MKFGFVLLLWLVVVVMLLFFGGCGDAAFAKYGSSMGDEVISLPNRDVADLCSDDVVKILLRSGLDEEQILKFGTDFRNAVATNGAARIRVGKKTEALFAVVDDYLHVSSRTRGSFIYDLEEKCCR